MADKVAAHDPGKTLFEILSPQGARRAVELAEATIKQTLPTDILRTGIRSIDYLVDQVLFMQAGRDDARRRGLSGLAALEWVEYLSWPECLRQARTAWRRALLCRHAFEEPTSRWQSALHANFEGDYFQLGPPRGPAGFKNVIYPPPGILFAPYPSEYSPPTKLAPATVHASITFNLWTRSSALEPVRRLTDAIVWTLKIATTSFYNGYPRGFLELVLDEPRDFSIDETRATLYAMANELEAWLDQMGQTLADRTSTIRRVTAMREAAGSLDGARSSQRAAVLEEFMMEPLAISLVTAILPEDLPAEWLGVFLALAAQSTGILSARDAKKVLPHATAVLERWQGKHYPRHELSQAEASRVIGRVARMRRLMNKKSLFSYLEKSVRGVEKDSRQM